MSNRKKDSFLGRRKKWSSVLDLTNNSKSKRSASISLEADHGRVPKSATSAALNQSWPQKTSLAALSTSVDSVYLASINDEGKDSDSPFSRNPYQKTPPYRVSSATMTSAQVQQQLPLHLADTAQAASSPSSSSSSSSTLKSAKNSSSRLSSQRKGSMFYDRDDGGASADSGAHTSPNGSGSLTSAFRPKRTGTVGKSQDAKLDKLTEILKKYEQALPEIPEVLRLDQPKFVDADFDLEPQWTLVVDKSYYEKMDKRQKNQQDAVWELLQTEITYIKKVDIITDLFYSVLLNLQSEQLLNDIEVEKLFANALRIRYVNREFWLSYLLPVVRQARQTGQPLNPSHLYDGFSKFHVVFDPYIEYCVQQASCLEYFKTKLSENECFAYFVTWAESHKICGRLRFNDLLTKPMQRLTKYHLLIAAIKKKSDEEFHVRQLEEMYAFVYAFVNKVNTSLKNREEKERLQDIASRIEPYDIVDRTNNPEFDKIVEEYTRFDLLSRMPGCRPSHVRVLLQQGAMKLKDPNLNKSDVYCFLFTDLFLVTKQKRNDKYKITKPPFQTDKLFIREMRDGGSLAVVYCNEYKVATTAFILQSPQMKKWLESFTRAKELYSEALRDSNSGMTSGQLFSADGEPNDDLLSGHSVERNESLDYADRFLPNLSDGSLSSKRQDVMSNHEEDSTPSHPSPAEQPSPPVHVVNDVSQNSDESTVKGSDPDETSALPRAARPARRHLTADAIADLKEKESSAHIMKRYSWNCNQDTSRVAFNNKMSNGESLRSMKSSSGVSSNGSLHTYQETEEILLLNSPGQIEEEGNGREAEDGSLFLDDRENGSGEDEVDDMDHRRTVPHLIMPRRTSIDPQGLSRNEEMPHSRRTRSVSDIKPAGFQVVSSPIDDGLVSTHILGLERLTRQEIKTIILSATSDATEV